MERRNVGILGATGAVGQRFIQLLADHPWFNITWLAASDRSAGKTYAEACHWRLDTPLPARIAKMALQPNTPEANTELPRIIFSSIDAPIARELEPKFAAAGCAVISNSSAFRMAKDVPLVVPRSTPITWS
jgi:aspartate-semialdehyde dehydrogenase